jgi:hypothetical protein
MKQELTQERLKELLYYDPDTGIFTWKERGIKNVDNRLYGKEAGAKSRGYLVTRLDDILYFNHRLAWLYMTGKLPKNKIDHINNIRNDNSFFNLREADQSQNSQNLKSAKINNKSTGLLGAFYCEKRKLFYSRIRINNKVIRLGYFHSAVNAHSAYINAKRKYHEFNTL